MEPIFCRPSPSLTCILAKPGRYEIVWSEVRAAKEASLAVENRHIPMSRPVFDEIVSTLSRHEPEVGGLLVGPKDHRLVTHFLFGEAGLSTPTTYTVDSEWLNGAMSRFRTCGLDVKGLVHSHPAGHPLPSEGDRRYLEKLLANPRNQASEVYFPIHCDGHLQAFIVTPHSLRVKRHWALPAQLFLL